MQSYTYLILDELVQDRVLLDCCLLCLLKEGKWFIYIVYIWKVKARSKPRVIHRIASIFIPLFSLKDVINTLMLEKKIM